MSVVVERGLARCPRCVAVADYTFAESGPNVVRYEVSCKRCGECYSEVHMAAAPDFTAAVEALSSPLPDIGGRSRPRGLRVLAWLAGARARSATIAAATVASARVGRGRPQWLRRRSHSGSD